MTEDWVEPLDQALADTRAEYAARGVGQKVGIGQSPAVVVVDFQLSYTRTWRSSGPESLHATARLLEAARSRDLPVFYTYVGFGPEDDPGVWGQIAPTLFENQRGSDACKIDPIVAPTHADSVLEKQVPSAFFGTGLDKELQEAGVDTVIVCGTSTSGCVRATVVDGLSHGYRVVLPEECLADPSAPSAKVALADIDLKYGDVTSLAEVIDELGGASDHGPRPVETEAS